jgi:hypothetical protein
VQAVDTDDQTPAVPDRPVLNPSAKLETAELGCVAAVASTEIDVSTSTIPARLAPTRARGLNGKRENHHDVRTRGTLSFLCDPGSNLSPATLLNATDGAVRVAPAPRLVILERVTAEAKARVSQRARKANTKAQSEKHPTAKKENLRANSIATASVPVGTRANTGMPMTAATSSKKGVAHMATTAPTGMQGCERRLRLMPSALADPEPNRQPDPTLQVGNNVRANGVRHRTGDARRSHRRREMLGALRQRGDGRGGYSHVDEATITLSYT